MKICLKRQDGADLGEIKISDFQGKVDTKDIKLAGTLDNQKVPENSYLPAGFWNKMSFFFNGVVYIIDWISSDSKFEKYDILSGNNGLTNNVEDSNRCKEYISRGTLDPDTTLSKIIGMYLVNPSTVAKKSPKDLLANDTKNNSVYKINTSKNQHFIQSY